MAIDPCALTGTQAADERAAAQRLFDAIADGEHDDEFRNPAILTRLKDAIAVVSFDALRCPPSRLRPHAEDAFDRSLAPVARAVHARDRRADDEAGDEA